MTESGGNQLNFPGEKRPGGRLHKKGGVGTGNAGLPDLWTAARTGSVADLELALSNLRKNGAHGNVDSRNAFGTTALHLAVWRNHCPIVRRLLSAGADPNARDGESGWSSLHRAFHFGHLAVAGLLIAAKASLSVEDTRGRTPIDVIPTHMRRLPPGTVSAMEVYSWGNGANYQLGTGSAGIQHVPCRVDALQDMDVIAVSAAKFHSAALTSTGELLTWGFGRGGRLGHPDFDIHSGQVAVIKPRQVVAGLGARRVKAVAAAKHHTIVATEGGEVFTWGSNRDGRLGYNSVDSQPTPRKVAALRAHVVNVAAANKHSAALTDNGEVYTWGCNSEGQLAYGTSNSASNSVPRCVDYLRGRCFKAIAAAKYHTAVLSSDGEVYTWGNKMVTPRKVLASRDVRKAGGTTLKFHSAARLHIVAIALGLAHSVALSQDGLVFFWDSADPNLRCRQMTSLAGHEAVAVAAGKYRTAVVTAAGEVFAWDSKNAETSVEPTPVRIAGLRHAVTMGVGETHSIAISRVDWPMYPPARPLPRGTSAAHERAGGESEGGSPREASGESDDEGLLEDAERDERGGASEVEAGVPTLKDMCQQVIAVKILDCRNALQVLEFADALGAYTLKAYAQALLIENLDYILTTSPATLGGIRSAVLADLEAAFAATSAERGAASWHLPSPTAPLPPVLDSDEEGSEPPVPRCPSFASLREAKENVSGQGGGASTSDASGGPGVPRFMQPIGEEGDTAVLRQLRSVRKKLQQIEMLEMKQAKGQTLDPQQLAKLSSKAEYELSLSFLEAGALPPAPQPPTPISETPPKHPKPPPNLPPSSPSPTLHPSPEPDEQTNNSNRSRRREGASRSHRRRNSRGETDQRADDTCRDVGSPAGELPARMALLPPPSPPANFSPGPRPMTSLPPPSSPANSNLGPHAMPSPYTEFPMTPLELPQQSPMSSEASTPLSTSTGVGRGGDSSTSSTPPMVSPLLLATPPPSKQAAGASGLGGASRGGKKKQVKKGGLSMFLTGELERVEAPAPVAPPPMPRSDLPAWKGSGSVESAKRSSLSLKEIQSLQEKSQASGSLPVAGPPRAAAAPSGATTALDAGGSGFKAGGERVGLGGLLGDYEGGVVGGPIRVPLAEFMKSSSPIAMAKRMGGGAVPALENSPLPWTRSPSSSAPSLRDIQQQQELFNLKKRRPGPPATSMGSSPGLATSPAAGATVPETPPLGTPPNRWFRPEMESPSSISAIQKEEAALKELRKIYGNARLGAKR